MKSAGNRGIVHGRLQMLHVHVFLVAPLGACDMAQASADEHQGGIAVWEGTDHSCPSSDFAVQPFNDIVRADRCV